MRHLPLLAVAFGFLVTSQSSAAQSVSFETNPIQRKHSRSDDPVLQACNSSCRSRIVGSFRCDDAEYLECIERTAINEVHNNLAHFRGRERDYCRATEQSPYVFKGIEEYFPAEKCLAAVDRRLTSWAELDREQRLQREARERQDAQRQQEAQAAQAQIVAELRSGKRAPNTFSERLVRDRIPEGRSVAASPKVRPDGARYGLIGILEISEGTTGFAARLSSGFAAELGQTLSGQYSSSSYFFVNVPPKLRDAYANQVKIGMGLNIIGRYIANRQYRTVSGEVRTMAVFELEEFGGWQ
jgi:hypothetical protein